MPITQTATTISAAVTATGAGSATNKPAVDLEKCDAIIRCVTSVTGAATISVQGRQVKGVVGTLESDWRELASFTTDNTLATRVIPLDQVVKNQQGAYPDQFRVNTSAYTAGTHTVSLLTHTQ